MPAEQAEKLAGEAKYRLFDLNNVVLAGPAGKLFSPTWYIAPLPKLTLRYEDDGAFDGWSLAVDEWLVRFLPRNLRINPAIVSPSVSRAK